MLAVGDSAVVPSNADREGDEAAVLKSWTIPLLVEATPPDEPETSPGLAEIGWALVPGISELPGVGIKDPLSPMPDGETMYELGAKVVCEAGVTVLPWPEALTMTLEGTRADTTPGGAPSTSLSIELNMVHCSLEYVNPTQAAILSH